MKDFVFDDDYARSALEAGGHDRRGRSSEDPSELSPPKDPVDDPGTATEAQSDEG